MDPVEQAVLVTRAPSEALLAERRRLGLDTHDEIWAGEHHLMTPGPSGPHAYLAGELAAVLRPLARASGFHLLTESNIGRPDDFRVRPGPRRGAARIVGGCSGT